MFMIFSQTSLRHFWLLLWQIRPSVICDVRAPYSGGLTFQGLRDRLAGAAVLTRHLTVYRQFYES